MKISTFNSLSYQIERANNHITARCIPGAIAWTTHNQFDLVRHARGAECVVDTAWFTGDMVMLRRGLRRYQSAYMDIFQAFKDPRGRTEQKHCR